MTLLSLSLAACSGADEGGDVPSSSVPVAFSALAGWDGDNAAGTGGTRQTENSNSTRQVENSSGKTVFGSGDRIGVFAYYNDSSTPDFMNNQEVAYDGTAWTYSPVKYWPTNVGDKLTFYAYRPYSDNSNNAAVKLGTNNGKPLLTFNCPDANIDLIAAKESGVTLSSNGGTVPLGFKHLLGKLMFTFSHKGHNDPVIHALKYEIPYKGEYNFKMPVSWSSIDDAKCELLRLTNESEGRVINESGITIDEFTAYLLPCTISKMSLLINNVFVDFSPTPAINILPGKQYTINIVISGDDNEHVFITSYSLWDSDGNIYTGKLK